MTNFQYMNVTGVVLCVVYFEKLLKMSDVSTEPAESARVNDCF